MKSTLDVATQKRTVSETERDEKKDWIVKGLAQIIPMIPSRQQTMEVLLVSHRSILAMLSSHWLIHLLFASPHLFIYVLYRVPRTRETSWRMTRRMRRSSRSSR